MFRVFTQKNVKSLMMNKTSMKKIKNSLIIIVVSILLLNPWTLFFIRIYIHEIHRGMMLKYRYKDDIYGYVYNSDKDDYWDDSSFECMGWALKDFEKITNDSVKMDSMLVILLSFRDKNGDIICNDIHRATISHVGYTRRYHLLPYMEQLRDSFSSYPEDVTFCTVRSDGDTITNRNIKKEIEIDIIRYRSYWQQLKTSSDSKEMKQ